MNKFNVGDKVRIIENLEEREHETELDIVPDMFEYSGKEAEITEVVDRYDDTYFINIDGGEFYWAAGLLMAVEED